MQARMGYAAHPVDQAAYLFYSPFFPCPYLRRYIVGHPGAMLAGIGCEFEVEARIVDKHEHIGTEVVDGFARALHVGCNLGQMAQHLAESTKAISRWWITGSHPAAAAMRSPPEMLSPQICRCA